MQVHVICMESQLHLILAVTSLNSKTEGSNLHIYYSLNLLQPINIQVSYI